MIRYPVTISSTMYICPPGLVTHFETTTIFLPLKNEFVQPITTVMLCVSQTIHDQSASLNTACVLQRLLLSRNHTVFNITDQHAGPLRTTCSVLN